ncbi:hypothetical protein HGRIS_013989 [Hohenbuehelia grisea]|uniref:Uncharacterized protein n=1 Tax=Hohenbuehelia grisea TaxID=104357 RepID=A0ABR3JS22_9AGAR
MEIAPKRRLGSKSHLAVPTFQIHNLAPAPNRNPGVNSCYSKLDFGSRSPNTLLSKVQLVHRELCRSPACSLSSKLLSGGSSFSNPAPGEGCVCDLNPHSEVIRFEGDAFPLGNNCHRLILLVRLPPHDHRTFTCSYGLSMATLGLAINP